MNSPSDEFYFGMPSTDGWIINLDMTISTDGIGSTFHEPSPSMHIILHRLL